MSIKPDASDFINVKPYTPKRGALTNLDFDPAADLDVLWDQVLILRDLEESMTEGGIYKPDMSLEPKHTGIICARGPDCSCPHLKKGLRVMFAKYSGAEIKIEGRTFALMSEHDILAIIHKESIRSDRID